MKPNKIIKKLLTIGILASFLIIIIITLFSRKKYDEDNPINETTTYETYVYEELFTESETITESETTIEEEEVEIETESETITTLNKYSAISFSPSDLYYIQCCVETETYTAPLDAKCNVASVILNRLLDGRFGNDITTIITNPQQFAYHRTDISLNTIEAITYVLANGDTTNGALYFHSNDKTETFNGATYIFTDEVGHHFYK